MFLLKKEKKNQQDSTESLTNLKTQILMNFTYSHFDKTQKLKF